jgi:hypothetical protein
MYLLTDNQEYAEITLLHYTDGCVQSISSYWVPVEEGRYSYCVSPDGDKVKFVITEYFAVEVCINIAV